MGKTNRSGIAGFMNYDQYGYNKKIMRAAELAVAKRKLVAQLKQEIRREHELIRKLRKRSLRYVTRNVSNELV